MWLLSLALAQDKPEGVLPVAESVQDLVEAPVDADAFVACRDAETAGWALLDVESASCSRPPRCPPVPSEPTPEAAP